MQATMFPSQLTWSRVISNSVATMERSVGHNLREDINNKKWVQRTVIGYRAKPCPCHASENIQKYLQFTKIK